MTNFKPKYSTTQEKASSIIMMQRPIEINLQTFRPNPSLRVEDQIEPILFCLCVWGESRNQCVSGQDAVARVILNRWIRQESYWGSSIREIVCKSGKGGIYQFSCMNPVDPNYRKMLLPDWISWFQVCRNVLRHYFEPEPLDQDSAYYYCHKEIADRPFFAKLRRVEEIEDHVFFSDLPSGS